MATHVMVDLETMGTMAGCVGFSIGAVQFLPEENKLGEEFYAVIDYNSCLEAMLAEEQGTKDWWAKQSAEARKALVYSQEGGHAPLEEVLITFNKWLASLGGFRSIRLYGNGADFDNPILRVMYDAAKVPFLGSKAGFFGGRCYRTLKNLDELFGAEFAAPKLERSGTHHNALDDAKTQALHLMEIVRRIRAIGNRVTDDLK